MIAFCFPLIFFGSFSILVLRSTISAPSELCWGVGYAGRGRVRILCLLRDLFGHWWIIQSVIYSVNNTLISLGNLNNFAIIIYYIHVLISYTIPMWYIAHFQVVIVQFVLFVCSIHVRSDTFSSDMQIYKLKSKLKRNRSCPWVLATLSDLWRGSSRTRNEVIAISTRSTSISDGYTYNSGLPACLIWTVAGS